MYFLRLKFFDFTSNFRKLARKYHPDQNPDKGAREKFVEIQEAYDVGIKRRGPVYLWLKIFRFSKMRRSERRLMNMDMPHNNQVSTQTHSHMDLSQVDSQDLMPSLLPSGKVADSPETNFSNICLDLVRHKVTAGLPEGTTLRLK